MKFLFVAKQEKNAITFLDTLRVLIERGHSVTLAVQERDAQRDERLAASIPSDRFAVVPAPIARTDEWAGTASLVRRLRDCAQYLRPPFTESTALQTRIFQKLRQELGVNIDAGALAGALRLIPAAQRGRLESLLRLAEASLPTAPLFDEFVVEQRPDVLLISPLVHFGSAQADVAASGRRLGVPVWMLLHSWDNLATKGCLHVEPDLMFVWNEQQRDEAAQLHGLPAERVVVVGAPRFDAFFDLKPAMSREEFHAPLGLDPSAATLLYLCSSRLIASDELSFIRRWVAAVRESPALANANIVIRPHPDIGLDGVTLVRHRWAAAPDLDAEAARPFDDSRVVVLRTSYHDPAGLFESLTHSIAVVGLNTTAELEAGIVGRPVFSIAPGARDENQQPTLHFHYLTRERGGFVSVAAGLDEHVAQLGAALAGGVDAASIRGFIESFLRPRGILRPVSPLLAEALERAASNRPETRKERAALSAAPPPPTMMPGPRDVVRLGYSAAPILVYAGPETVRAMRKGAVHLDRTTVNWLEESVKVGDVVYDVNSGFGAYTLLAAKQRGAVVVAFEPGYKVYAALCENLLLNDLHGLVIPVPLALANRDGIARIKYHREHPGEERYSVLSDEWRARPPEAVQPHVQSACAMRLDMAVARYGLPPPTHLRLSRHVAVNKLLDGAADTLARPSLRSVYVQVPEKKESALVERLGALGMVANGREAARKGVHLVFTRGSR